MITVYFNLDDDGYLDGISSTKPGHQYSVDIDETHEVLQNPEIFKYVDGELVKVEDRQQQLIEEYEKSKNEPSETERLQQDNEMLAMAVMELSQAILNGGD